MTFREFKEEIEGSMLILLVMPMKKHPTLAPVNKLDAHEKESDIDPFKHMLSILS